MPESAATTLFGDYSLSGQSIGSPVDTPGGGISRGAGRPLDVVFPTSNTNITTTINVGAPPEDTFTTQPPRVTRRASDEYSLYDPEMEEIELEFGNEKVNQMKYYQKLHDGEKPVPAAMTSMGDTDYWSEKQHINHRQLDEEGLDAPPMRKNSDFNKTTARARKGTGYNSYEGCMEGGTGHEIKSTSYPIGTEKAYHHLNRANELFGLALQFKPTSAKAMLCRANILINLATSYQPPRTATVSLREARSLLRDLVAAAPRSTSAREALARACGLLSSTLLETDDTADDQKRVWESEAGKLAREALQYLEDVAGDRMDNMREMNQEQAAAQSPQMAETFLALSEAAIIVSSLATDLNTVDLHIELAEQALDQASNMATVAAAAKVRSSTFSANLITRVQLASNRSSLERLRHTFLLGVDLDEDDFRSLMTDMSMLATEARERAAKLRGTKAGTASTLAYEAVRQFGDAKVLYACLLRLVWRQRKPRHGKNLGPSVPNAVSTSGSMSGSVSSDSSRRPSLANRKVSTMGSSFTEAAIQEETEDEIAESEGRKPSTLSTNGPSDTRTSIPESVTLSQKRFSDVSAFQRGGSFSQMSIMSGGSSRRGSWLPTTGDALAGRNRRMSSMSAPLVGPDGINAWNRKSSVIRLVEDEQAEGLVPSLQLAHSAWQLLESAVKQFKLALTLISSSDLSSANLARAKADVLGSIAYCSMFRASLAPRVPAAMEKRTSLLVTAEVYATWAAREVGWSFLIEGTKEAQLADRRTNSWRADESGKRAVMILIRIWWHRAVTTPSIDVDTKSAAKDAVEVVVRRMKDREGVKDGDVARFRAFLSKLEGDMDPAEVLFWRSVSRILRGGAGFVMS